MTHGEHVKDVQAAFHRWLVQTLLHCLPPPVKQEQGCTWHLLGKLNKAGSGTALLTYLLNPDGEGCQR